MEFIDEILGLSLKSEQLGFGHMAARAFLMYLLLLVIVRNAKKRFLSNATAYDFILTIMIGAIAARALTEGSAVLPCHASHRCDGDNALGHLVAVARITSP
jgi:beta-lactamase regulating signal transducer with metallopeptidase domain